MYSGGVGCTFGNENKPERLHVKRPRETSSTVIGCGRLTLYTPTPHYSLGSKVGTLHFVSFWYELVVNLYLIKVTKTKLKSR